ncbi:hypothetical protein [Bartonella tamiae]|uniref:DUF4376 domain-containing protein n=1 Tax=Bartonella tamiae Th239 TaxID=1094558 RepID=J0QZU0_9HYPH|nr:hypothetical protein [Bartonella tamiae]EJF91696.1 hypothetical protein ME5_00075 [Bartonella tamiae Th239]
MSAWFRKPNITYPSIYHYHYETKEYLGKGHADPSPLEEGIFSDPAYSTRRKPPKKENNKTPIWQNNNWILIDDCRDEIWFDNEGNEITIDFIGNPSEKGLAPNKPEPSKPDMKEFKSHIKQFIDQNAEQERLKYITNGVGQSMTYQEKVAQAENYSGQYTAYLANPDKNTKPNEAEYPLLKASLGIDGDTLLEVAETVTFAYTQWQYVGAEIEKTRLQAKQAIDEAKTIQAAQAVYDAIKWPNV